MDQPGPHTAVAPDATGDDVEDDVEQLDATVLTALVEQAPDGIVVVDASGVIRYWNSGAERIFGYSATDALGSSLDLIIPERLRARHSEGFHAAIARGTSRYGADDLLAVPAIGAGGRALSIEFSVVLLAGRDGIEYVGALIRDVTERWHAERDLRRRLRELEAGAATVSQADA